jgi:hypothetical protein
VFPWQPWLPEPAPLLRYTFIACLVETRYSVYFAVRTESLVCNARSPRVLQAPSWTAMAGVELLKDIRFSLSCRGAGGVLDNVEGEGFTNCVLKV